MKTIYDCFEKGHRTHEKKQIIFKNKIKTDVPNTNFFGGAHELCFTNMKIVLQKCVPNNLLPFALSFCNLVQKVLLVILNP